jgi:kynureninase
MNLEREHARALDAADPLRSWRARFLLPTARGGADPLVYLCGHSLGLQPRLAESYVREILNDWGALGVEGHFSGRHPWVPYHERLAGPLARLVGAHDAEVVAMNSLTVNLHLLLVSFYRPAGERTALLIEKSAFPSDRYAAWSQVRFHGLDPARDLVEIAPRDGEDCLRTEDIVERLERDGPRIATVLLPGIQYVTGQLLDLREITRAARRAGCAVGFDLAHAIGNVELSLHDVGADFAVWCSYKFLNGGPGAIGGAFVHERHARRDDLPRFAGWWGHDKATRFDMGPEFSALPGPEGWQLSNPPVLAMAPLIASLEYFDAAGLPALRRKSIALTGYLESLLHERLATLVRVVTPRAPDSRGATLSLRLETSRDRAFAVFEGLRRRGVVTDWREPATIRVAPVPLYNGYEDAWRCVESLAAELA